VTKLKSFKELLVEYEIYSRTHRLDREPEALYLPINYIMSQSSKKIRPLALMMIAEMCGADIDHSVKAAYSIELFHNFTLVHDDIMDDAALRRGEDTVYKKFGLNSAILSGDVMMIESLRLLNEVEFESKKKGLVKLFVKTGREICEGQSLDMGFEKKSQVELEEYLEMIRLKTAVLLACSMKMGAILGSKNEDFQRAIYAIGQNIGVGFQIQDDWLDTYGDFSKVGKTPYGDIVQTKRTALYLHAFQKSNGIQKEKLMHLYSKETASEKRVKEVLEIFQNLNVENDVRQLFENYKSSSLAIVNTLKVKSEFKKSLTDFIEMIFQREF
jgi:geranylgeranyl diphosphate synthase type II